MKCHPITQVRPSLLFLRTTEVRQSRRAIAPSRETLALLPPVLTTRLHFESRGATRKPACSRQLARSSASLTTAIPMVGQRSVCVLCCLGDSVSGPRKAPQYVQSYCFVIAATDVLAEVVFAVLLFRSQAKHRRRCGCARVRFSSVSARS